MRGGPFRRRRQRRNRLRTLRFGHRHRERALQCHSQHLVHGIDKVQFHRGAQVFRHFCDILLVVLRQDDLEQADEQVRLLSARAHFDALILDDGFQHLRLRRDLDLILINAARGFGNGWVIPAGPLREPRSALSRADAIVLIDSGGRQTPLLTAANLAMPEHLPIIHASIRPRALVRANDAGWQEYPLVLAGRRIVAVNGLADAAGFHAMLTDLGATLAATFDFPDHHDYTPHDIENILSAMRAADHIVTTEKDLVKLERFPLADVSLYALRLDVSMDAGDEARMFDLLTAAMHRRRDLRLPDDGGRAPN